MSDPASNTAWLSDLTDPEINVLLFRGLEVVLILGVTWLSSRILGWALRQTQKRNLSPGKALRYMPLFRLAVWGLGLSWVLVIVLHSSVWQGLLLIGPIGIAAGLAGRDLMRNFLAGIILAVDRKFNIGDVIRVDEQEGEVRSIGLRSVRLEANGGHMIEIPNINFLNHPVSNITPDLSDVQVRITMVFPREIDVVHARKIAYRAAAVSRYASPRRAPEVFVNTHFDQTFLLRITVLGFAFNPSFEEHFRSDVIEMMREKLGSFPSPDVSPEDTVPRVSTEAPNS